MGGGWPWKRKKYRGKGQTLLERKKGCTREERVTRVDEKVIFQSSKD